MAQPSHAPLPDAARASHDDASAPTDFGWNHIRDAARAGSLNPPAPQPDANTPERLDALGQQMRLKEAYPAPDRPAAPDGPDRGGAGRPETITVRASPMVRRILKTALGCLIVALAGFVPVQRLLQVASSEAIVTARVITVRTPIDGQIDPLGGAPQVGTAVKSGAVLLRIANRRADRSRLDDLRRLIDEVESERAAASERLELLRSQEVGLVAQTRAFQRGRIRQLEERVAEVESEIKGAVATRTEAGAALLRTSILADNGIQTKAAHARAERDDAVAEQAENALRRRLAGVKIELDAARQGMFVGDSYNDRPSSSQHADEVVLRIGELQAELRMREERLAHLRTELTNEADRYADQSRVELTAPVSGSVWELLVAPGEQVARGQDLMRLLDCSGVMVTAAVSERVYEKLHIGDPARFRQFGETADYSGRVIRLGGRTGPADNWALGSAALPKDLFRVTVSISGMTESSCAVGRPGRVVFEPKVASAATASAAGRVLSVLGLR